MRARLIALLGAVCVTSSSCVTNESKDYVTPTRTIFEERPYKVVWEEVLKTFEELGIQIRSSEKGQVRSRRVKDGEVSWRFYVKVVQEEAKVKIQAHLDIHHSTQIDTDTVGDIVEQAIADSLDDKEWIERRDERRSENLEREQEAGIRWAAHQLPRFLAVLRIRISERPKTKK